MSDTRNADGERPGQRGPAEHGARNRILEAAHTHFLHYGYGKTTVADLARAIGVSPAYVYKFFDSKQAIGEAVCTQALGKIVGVLNAVADEPKSASERLRRVYKTLVIQGIGLYFNERKLHDIVSAAIDEAWCPIAGYREELSRIVRRLLIEGREAGEFERKTPLDDAVTAIACTLAPFCHPTLLEQTEQADLQTNAEQVAALVLRSLAP